VPWRIQFELMRYDWLLEKAPADAYAYLDTLSARFPNNPDLVRREIEAGFSRHEKLPELLARLDSINLSPADRARVLLAAAQSTADGADLLSRAQKIITDLPASPDRDSLVLWLLKIKTAQGSFNEALAGCERILETNISADMRNRTELLRASVLEALGDPGAENAYLSLTQRPDEDIRIRAQARLAVFYSNKGRKDEAKSLLRGELLEYLKRGNLSVDVLRDLAYAYANLKGLLSPDEADTLQNWLEDYAPGA
jgi:hypothetical protein